MNVIRAGRHSNERGLSTLETLVGIVILGRLSSADGVSDLVTYDLSRGALRRTVQARASGAWAASRTDTLATNLPSLSFTFLDAGRAPLTASQVLAGGTTVARYVRISVGTSGSLKAGVVSKTLLGEVAFRN